ncbi:MAG TPA: hypothetical protein VLF60_00065 [Candidatus Saccharimonadales bacterium]|nr:hypothetical protein [Candidatus Saccharimonadales bacterium]
MADINYDDVKRATQDAVRNLQNAVNDLRNGQDDVRRKTQQLDNVTFRLNSIQSQLNVIQQELESHINSMRQVQGSSQNMQALQNQQADTARRVAGMEQMLRACYQFLAALSQRQQP